MIIAMGHRQKCNAILQLKIKTSIINFSTNSTNLVNNKNSNANKILANVTKRYVLRLWGI